MIGLAFVLPAIMKLGLNSCGHGSCQEGCSGLATEKDCCQGPCQLGKAYVLGLSYPLCNVSRSDMADFMTQHRRQFIHGVHNLYKTGKDKDVSPWAGKCVQVVRLDDVKVKREEFRLHWSEKVLAQVIDKSVGKGVIQKFKVGPHMSHEFLSHGSFILYGKGKGLGRKKAEWAEREKQGNYQDQCHLLKRVACLHGSSSPIF